MAGECNNPIADIDSDIRGNPIADLNDRRVHPSTATISEWPDKKHLDAITNLHGSVVRSDLSLAPRFRPCSTTKHRDHQKGNDNGATKDNFSP